MTDDLTPQQEVMVRLGRDRVLAHKTLFAHRHDSDDPPFRAAMINDFHSPEQYICELSFRGSSKSTTAEEGMTIMALYQEFKLGVIFGSSYDLAAERLHAIRKEFETNEMILTLWGDMRGARWGDDRIELSNGVVIKAMGRGEAMRGTKGDVERPDFALFDDIEDSISLGTEKGRDRIQNWFWLDALPAMTDPARRRVRVAANAMHPECLAMKLKHPDSGFRVRTTPIEYLDEDGERQPSWPARFPLSFIDDLKRKMYAVGKGLGYEAEYMCNPTSAASRPFRSDMFYIEPRTHTWQAVYCMFDPARTVKAQSATTGFAAWSWEADKLIVWEAWGRRLMPNEIIEAMFQVQEDLHPVHIGFEEDGLNQWALQPIRLEMIKRGIALPLKAMKAPNGKIDFIRGLQPHFQGRLVHFAKPLPDLNNQLLGFPTGEIDVPNALAYAMKMRPGAPIYDDFRGHIHVDTDLTPIQGRPLWLCLNASRGVLTGLVCQVFDQSIRIFGDVVLEGDPGEKFVDALSSLRLQFGRELQCIGGPLHFDQYNNVGLRQAALRTVREFHQGLPPDRGRAFIRNALRTQRDGTPMLMVHDRALWTLNAFAGGYSRALLKQGVLADFADDGVYKILMEGLESFCGLLEAGGSTDGDDGDRFNATTAQGRPYRSMLGGRR